MKFNSKNVNLIFFGAIVLLVIIGAAFRSNPDTDAFFLIQTGEYIVKTMSVPTVNLWTMHEGLNMIVQQWLCCVLNYGAYHAVGYGGLIALSIIQSCILAVCFYVYARLFSIDRSNAFLKASFLWLFTYVYTTSRPYLGTITISVLILYCLERLKRTENIKYGIFVSLLVILQANWQVSMIILPILFLITHTLGAIAEHKDDLSLKMSVTMTLSFGAVFINPYGINGVMYLFKGYNRNLSKIAEMQAPIVGGKYGTIIIIAILVLCYRMYIYKRDKVAFDPVHALLLAGGIGMAIMNIRSMWMILPGIIPLLPDIIKPKERTANPLTFASLFLSVCVVIVGSILVIGNGKEVHAKTVEALTHPNITAYLTENVPIGTEMYAVFHDSQYYQFLGYKTYIDGRAEIYTKSINGKFDYWDEYCNINFAEDLDVDGFIDKYKFEYMEVNDNSYLGIYMRTCDDYEVVARDGLTSLWKRKE